MTVSQLSQAEASELAVQALGLDPDLVSLSSAEGIAASIRRAASFMCPTSPTELISAVLAVLQPVDCGTAISRDVMSDLLDLLLAAGDLLELRDDIDGRTVRLLYLGPPSYVERQPGVYLLSGVRPYGAPLVDAELSQSIEHDGEARTVRLDPTEADERLASAGVERIERERWVSSPAADQADRYVTRLAKQLDLARPSGDVEGLQIIDPAAPVRYYRGRWRSPAGSDTGDFVARRPQQYGADLWCVVRLENRAPMKMLEFPVDDPLVPARDEAWRLQMAIDAQRGTPQVYATRPLGADAEVAIRFFSPIPGFAQRYLELAGVPLAEELRCLFAFRVAAGAIPDLERMLSNLLWMKPDPREEPDGV
jgi:hypothetical protein